MIRPVTVPVFAHLLSATFHRDGEKKVGGGITLKVDDAKSRMAPGNKVVQVRQKMIRR